MVDGREMFLIVKDEKERKKLAKNWRVSRFKCIEIARASCLFGGNVHHPVNAELVRAHAELVSPDLFGERHGHHSAS
jgi:hypothetical protein